MREKAMSIALERNNTTPGGGGGSNSYSNHDHEHDHRIGRSGYSGQKMTCFSIYGDDNSNNSPEGNLGAAVGDRRKLVEDSGQESSSSTSSIGRNSDESSAGRSDDGGEGEEVQSQYKGGAFENLEALEEVLPMNLAYCRRSISQFYTGKSKSFTSLADAASYSSVKDIVKPENAYTRKRKNLLAFNNFWEKNRNGIRRSSSGGISKRHINSRSTLALAATMGCAESNNNSDSSNSNSPSPGICLPPLPPQVRRTSYNDSSSSPPEQKFSPWRSLSLSDLQGVAATPSISGIMVNNRHE